LFFPSRLLGSPLTQKLRIRYTTTDFENLNQMPSLARTTSTKFIVEVVLMEYNLSKYYNFLWSFPYW